jgi:2-polyprenyl-6-hydroxyphenyl methylase/3-demethylubiquinone-9 3-methyltransferase
LAAVAAREYHESLWEQVPEGTRPEAFARRRAFLLSGVDRDQRVLDVGCGEGWFTSALAGAGARAVGIDVAEEPLRRARARDPGLDLQLVAPDGPWPFESAAFDVVWAGEVIEHVADTGAWLSEVRRVLGPGGGLLLTTPDHGPLALLGLAVAPRRLDSHFDPRSDHLRFYTRRTLRGLLEDFRFDDVQIRGAGRVPGVRRTLLARARRGRF